MAKNWHCNHCSQCDKFSWFSHYIFDNTNPTEIGGQPFFKTDKNADGSESQWVFCGWNCFREWKKESLCKWCMTKSTRLGTHWSRKTENDGNKFCSEKCCSNYYIRKSQNRGEKCHDCSFKSEFPVQLEFVSCPRTEYGRDTVSGSLEVHILKTLCYPCAKKEYDFQKERTKRREKEEEEEERRRRQPDPEHEENERQKAKFLNDIRELIGRIEEVDEKINLYNSDGTKATLTIDQVINQKVKDFVDREKLKKLWDAKKKKINKGSPTYQELKKEIENMTEQDLCLDTMGLKITSECQLTRKINSNEAKRLREQWKNKREQLEKDLENEDTKTQKLNRVNNDYQKLETRLKNGEIVEIEEIEGIINDLTILKDPDVENKKQQLANLNNQNQQKNPVINDSDLQPKINILNSQINQIKQDLSNPNLSTEEQEELKKHQEELESALKSLLEQQRKLENNNSKIPWTPIIVGGSVISFAFLVVLLAKRKRIKK